MTIAELLQKVSKLNTTKITETIKNLNKKLDFPVKFKNNQNEISGIDIVFNDRLNELENIEPVEVVNSNWDAKENESGYIENKPMNETKTALFSDSEIKFDENGSLVATIYSDNALLLGTNTVNGFSIDNNLIIKDFTITVSDDGKLGGGNFSVYKNNSGQGGGGINISFNEETNKFVYNLNGSGNPSVVKNEIIKFFVSDIKKLNSKFIDIDNSSIVINNNDKLCVDTSSSNFNKFARTITSDTDGDYSEVTSNGIVITNQDGWEVKLISQNVIYPTNNMLSRFWFDIKRLNSNYEITEQNKSVKIANIKVNYRNSLKDSYFYNRIFVKSLCRWYLSHFIYVENQDKYEYYKSEKDLGGMNLGYWIGNEVKRFKSFYRPNFQAINGHNGFEIDLYIECTNFNDDDFLGYIPQSNNQLYYYNTKPIVLI